MGYVSKLKIAVALSAGISLAGCNTFATPGPMAGSGPSSARDQSTRAHLEGNLPKSEREIRLAKEQFRERNFGKAEAGFRSIVESEPRNAEAWLGLAASYDQLRRFKLADRAYAQVRAIDGESVALHNNMGYSYLLRGDRRKARRAFLKAASLDPNNPFVQNNMDSLARKK